MPFIRVHAPKTCDATNASLGLRLLVTTKEKATQIERLFLL
jgi:hypothetical protein